MKKAGFTALRMDDLEMRPFLQKLVTPSYKRLKDWVVKKTVDEQSGILSRQLTKDESRLADLTSSENQR